METNEKKKSVRRFKKMPKEDCSTRINIIFKK